MCHVITSLRVRERAAVAEERDGVDVVLDVLHADQQRVVHEAARAEPVRVVEQLRHNLPRASVVPRPRPRRDTRPPPAREREREATKQEERSEFSSSRCVPPVVEGR